MVTKKQEIFIHEYLKDFNGTQAAIRAGYSPCSAQSTSSEILSYPIIQTRVREVINERLMSADEVLIRLGAIARGDLGDFMDIGSMAFQLDLNKAKEKGLTSLLKKVKQQTITTSQKDGTDEERNTIEIELYSAIEALELIGKYHKLFVDRTEVTGQDGKPLVDPEMIEKVIEKIYGGH